MKQMTLAAVKGFEKHERTMRKAEFLARMDGLMPWAEFCALSNRTTRKPGMGDRRWAWNGCCGCTAWLTGSI